MWGHKVIFLFVFSLALVHFSFEQQSMRDLQADQATVPAEAREYTGLNTQKDLTLTPDETTDISSESSNAAHSPEAWTKSELPKPTQTELSYINAFITRKLKRLCNVESLLNAIATVTDIKSPSKILAHNLLMYGSSEDMGTPCTDLANLWIRSAAERVRNKADRKRMFYFNAPVTKREKYKSDRDINQRFLSRQIQKGTGQYPREKRSVKIPVPFDIFRKEISKQKYRHALEDLIVQNGDALLRYIDRHEPKSPTESKYMLYILNTLLRDRFGFLRGRRIGAYKKRVSFNSWGGKRSVDSVRQPAELAEQLDDPQTITETSDKPTFNSWGGKRAYRPRSSVLRRIRRGTFNSWGGKRTSYHKTFDADLAINDGSDDDLEIYVRSAKRKDPSMNVEPVDAFNDIDRKFLNLDLKLWREEPDSPPRFII